MVVVVLVLLMLIGVSPARGAESLDFGPPGAVPESAKLALDEDWSIGRIDSARWYALRKKWGEGNNGVVPENVFVAEETIAGQVRKVLVCRAHGDRYDGPLIGWQGKGKRVGGVLVSKDFFASGRFEVEMKMGGDTPREGGPADPRRMAGAIPAVWTYSYGYVSARRGMAEQFDPSRPMYNPLMQRPAGANEYWAELDFPEFGKHGDFDKALYNTFTQNRHEPKLYDVKGAADGQWHTLTTEWRTELRELAGVTDAQVVESGGLWWVADKSIAFESYLGNPLKKLAKDRYAAYMGKVALHWIDGRPVARNDKWVPSMAGQLNLGVWLPDWAGRADWKEAEVRFGRVRVWQYGDEGDVRGVLMRDIANNFDEKGRALR